MMSKKFRVDWRNTGETVVTPYDPEFEAQMKAARRGMSRYRNALRELARQ